MARISDEKYTELLNTCVRLIQQEIVKQDLDFLDTCEVSYCLTRDIFKGSVASIKAMGIEIRDPSLDKYRKESSKEKE